MAYRRNRPSKLPAPYLKRLWLDPTRVSKVRRNDVYRIMTASLPLVASNGLLRAWASRRMSAIETELNAATPR